MHSKKSFYRILCGLFTFLLAAHVLSILILGGVPPVSVDALIYHLEIPRLYLEHGAVYEIPSIPFSYYPMNLGLLYMIPLFFGNDIIPKYIHFFFALATAFLIGRYLKNKLNGVYGLAGALFFLTVPLIVKLSTVVYADLGLICFATAALLQILKWTENRFQFKYLVVSAICAGLAAGTKYTGLIVVLSLGVLVVCLYLKDNPERRFPGFRAVGFGLAFYFIALLVFSPWMIRNTVWTGNPVYPTYDRIFNPENRSDEIPLVSGTLFESRREMFNESLPQILLLPVRVFFEGRDGNPKRFDGVLSPFLFLLPFLVLLKSGGRSVFQRDKAVFLYFTLFIFGYFLIATNMTQIRLIGPVIPSLVILSVFGVHEVAAMIGSYPNGVKKRVGVAVISVVIALACFFHGLYVIRRFQSIRPASYILGDVGRDEYIERHRPEHPAMQYINRNLPEHSKILGVLIGYRGYYCDRTMVFLEQEPLFYAVINAKSPRMLLEFFQKDGAGHFIIWFRYFDRWCKDNFRPSELLNIDGFFAEHTELLFSKNGYRVYRLVD